MRLKYTIIIVGILSLSVCETSFSQNISILLSVSDDPYCEGDTLMPYLAITYANNSSNNYYFPSLFWSESRIPYFGAVLMKLHIFSRNEEDKAKIILIKEDADSYQGGYYSLSLDYLSGPGWPIWCVEPGLPDHFINFYLAAYYDQLYEREIPPSMDFSDVQLSDEAYLRNCPAFVFIKAGESITQRISLRGFWAARIHLRIKVSSEYPPDRVINWVMSNKVVLHLPLKVDEYELYSDRVESNELIIDFSAGE